MNVYDFDRTIFYPDSMFRFTLHCAFHHPSLFLNYGPRLLKTCIKFIFKKASLATLNAQIYTVIKYLKHPERDIDRFWKKYKSHVRNWYLMQKRNDDLIISSTPTYLLKPLTDKLGVNLIASNVDQTTGLLLDEICMAREKARRIIALNMPIIENFYSDSLVDTPIALLAEKAYLVYDHANKFRPWPHVDEITAEINRKINIHKHR